MSNTEGSESAKHGRKSRGAERKHKRILESLDRLSAAEEILIPIERKARKAAQITRGVKREENNDEDRSVKDRKNDENVKFREEFHTMISSSLSENLFITASEMRMRIIITSDTAAPVW